VARGAAACAAVPLAATSVAAGATRADQPAFVVVVHRANPAEALPREQVARLFLRKVKRWPDGAEAEPVDLAPNAPARAAFTRAVLGKSVATVRAYWQQRIFSGAEVPPPEKMAEAEVLEYVRTHPAAVTYVSGGATLPSGVRALTVTE
jgi:ABC-type phosphate transport system substrate-binding protein